MEKEIICDFPQNPNPSMQLINSVFLSKKASMASELLDAIDNLERKRNHVYVLINALSAGEYFGPNRS